MAYPVTFTESLALIAQRSPQSEATSAVDGPDLMFGADGTLNTPINQAFVVVQTGTVGASITVKLEQATEDTFGDKKDITGKTVSLTVSNTQGIINLKSEELDTANGFKYWRYRADGVDTNLFGILIFGGDSRYGPASPAYDLDTVTVVK